MVKNSRPVGTVRTRNKDKLEKTNLYRLLYCGSQFAVIPAPICRRATLKLLIVLAQIVDIIGNSKICEGSTTIQYIAKIIAQEYLNVLFKEKCSTKVSHDDDISNTKRFKRNKCNINGCHTLETHHDLEVIQTEPDAGGIYVQTCDKQHSVTARNKSYSLKETKSSPRRCNHGFHLLNMKRVCHNVRLKIPASTMIKELHGTTSVLHKMFTNHHMMSRCASIRDGNLRVNGCDSRHACVSPRVLPKQGNAYDQQLLKATKPHSSEISWLLKTRFYYKRLQRRLRKADQRPMDEGQQQDNGRQKHLKMSFTASRAPQWAKVFLVSLGRAQLLRNALHLCNTLSTKELRKRGWQLAEKMAKYPEIFSKYFNMDTNMLNEVLNVMCNYKNKPAIKVMLVSLGKAHLVQNALDACGTLSMEGLMAKGLYLVKNLAQWKKVEQNKDALLDDMNILLSTLNQNEYSTEYSGLCNEDVVNTAASIESSINQETVEWIKSELERHHNHSQDELTFCTTNLTSDMNLNGHTHSTEEEKNVINELSALAAHLHHGSMKKIIMDVEDHHHSSSEELMTMSSNSVVV